MHVTSSASPMPWWFSILPLIVVGAVVLGVAFLVILAIPVSRRVTMTLRTGGAVTLTLASVILLSGLWCMFLSPTTTYSQVKDSFYRSVSIQGLSNWSYSLSLLGTQGGYTLVGYVSLVRPYDSTANGSVKTFDVHVYGPQGTLVWYEANVTYSDFQLKLWSDVLPWSRSCKIDVRNPNPDAMECFVQFTVSEEVTVRPLEPLGQWLSLISLPVIGLGMWASGLLGSSQKRTEQPA